MLVPRIGEALQPAGARSLTGLAEATSALAGKIQATLEQTAAATREAFEKQLANFLIILLTPASMVALVFGLWRVTADLGWTGTFVISSGLFSHWQVWMALAIALKFAASSLQIPSRQQKTSQEN